MTPFGSSRGEGDDRAEKITIKNNRRIDRDTGAVRPGVGEGSADASPTEAGTAAGGATADIADAVAAAQAEAAERTADLQRLTAEYANYRKRVDRDKQMATSAGKAAVVAELLAVCDDLDRAEEHGDLVGGFKNVADKFTDILQRLGLEHYGAQGDEFDPNIHEAVQFTTAPDVTAPTVSAVLRLGYLFEERVLRPAVVVVTGPEDDGAATPAEDRVAAAAGDREPALVDDAGPDGTRADGTAADGAAGTGD